MSPLSRLLYGNSAPSVRTLFTTGTDPTLIEAASLAGTRGLTTPMLPGCASAAAEAAPEISLDPIVFLDLDDWGVHTETVDLAMLLVSEGVAHAVVLGADVDLSRAVARLEDDHAISPTVFLEFPSNAVLVLTDDTHEHAVSLAEIHVRELFGPGTHVRRIGDPTLAEVQRRPESEILICDVPDHDFTASDLLHRFGGAAAYGPIAFGAPIPTGFLRPSATVEDVLGTLALLSAIVPHGGEAAVDHTVQRPTPEVRPLW